MMRRTGARTGSTTRATYWLQRPCRLGTHETMAYANIANQKARSTQPSTTQALHEREVTAWFFVAARREACVRRRALLEAGQYLVGHAVEVGRRIDRVPVEHDLVVQVRAGRL